MENSKPSKPYFSILITSLQENRKPLFRMWLFMTTVSLISMLLGIGIFIITLGVLFPVKKILVYWPPANAWLSKTFGLKTPKPNKPDSLINHQRLITIFHIAITLLYVIIGAVIVKTGIDILLRDGFLGQNLIYLILR